MTRLNHCRFTGPMRRHALVGVLLVASFTASAAPAAAQGGEVIEYYGVDAIGSIRVVFDVNGTVVARNDYVPFGESFTPSGPLPSEQFTGQARDGEAGLDYFGARFYQPRHGRFSSVDPVFSSLEDPQQWNRYAYARNGPLSYVDPTGLSINCATVYRASEHGPDKTINCAGGSAGTTSVTASLRPEHDAGTAMQQEIAAERNAERERRGVPGSDRIPVVNETTGEVQYLTPGELVVQAVLAATAITAMVALPAATAAATSAEGASALALASAAAAKAANSPIITKLKHLPDTAGQFNKYAPGVDSAAAARQALMSPSAQFLPNGKSQDTFTVLTNLARVIGTRGETAVKVVLDFTGRIITHYPMRARR